MRSSSPAAAHVASRPCNHRSSPAFPEPLPTTLAGRSLEPIRGRPFVFACKVQRAGSFTIEECAIGEMVPAFKYEVCLEEIDEILEEYSDGPFSAPRAHKPLWL